MITLPLTITVVIMLMNNDTDNDDDNPKLNAPSRHYEGSLSDLRGVSLNYLRGHWPLLSPKISVMPSVHGYDGRTHTYAHNYIAFHSSTFHYVALHSTAVD